MKQNGRTLYVDRDGNPAPDRARSLGDALTLLLSGEYDTIVLYSSGEDPDAYGVVEFLAATWPAYLQMLTVRSESEGKAYVWNPEHARFDLG